MVGLIAFVINLVILCIILAILYWIVMKALTLLPFDVGPATTIVQIVFALIVLLWVLSFFSAAPVVFYPYHVPPVR